MVKSDQKRTRAIHYKASSKYGYLFYYSLGSIVYYLGTIEAFEEIVSSFLDLELYIILFPFLCYIMALNSFIKSFLDFAVVDEDSITIFFGFFYRKKIRIPWDYIRNIKIHRLKKKYTSVRGYTKFHRNQAVVVSLRRSKSGFLPSWLIEEIKAENKNVLHDRVTTKNELVFYKDCEVGFVNYISIDKYRDNRLAEKTKISISGRAPFFLILLMNLKVTYSYIFDMLKYF